MYIPKVYLRHYKLRQNINVKKIFSDKIQLYMRELELPKTDLVANFLTLKNQSLENVSFSQSQFDIPLLNNQFFSFLNSFVAKFPFLLFL